MPQLVINAKYEIGQIVAVKKRTERGEVRVDTVAVIMPIISDGKVQICYILDRDYHRAVLPELSNRVYLEFELLTEDEAKESASKEKPDLATDIMLGYRTFPAEEHYLSERLMLK